MRNIVAALLVPMTLAQGTVIINETFVDGERATQDLANNSMAWWSSSSSSSVVVGLNALQQLTGTSGRAITAFFTDATGETDPLTTTPVTVGVGETLVMKFVIQFDDATPPISGTSNDLRVGVFDSHGYRTLVQLDNHKGTNSTTNANANFANYTGYAFTGGLDPARPIALRKKFAPSDGILIASTAVYTALGSTTNSGHTLVVEATDYTGRLMIDNTGSGAIVTYSLDKDGTNYAMVTRTDTDSPHLTFDTVAFIVGSNVMDGFTLKQVEISKVASAPAATISGEITGANFEITCPSESGFLYQLQVSTTELDENDFAATAVETQAGTGADLTFTVAGPAAGEKKFYRVVPTVNP